MLHIYVHCSRAAWLIGASGTDFFRSSLVIKDPIRLQKQVAFALHVRAELCMSTCSAAKLYSDGPVGQRREAFRVLCTDVHAVCTGFHVLMPCMI